MRLGRTLKRLLTAGLFALLAFAPGLLLPGTAKAGGDDLAVTEDGFAIDQFYDELAPYGEWVSHPSYGYVWLPRTVAPDWRPYTVGNWVDTEEYGWYWESDEPFAWAVYHYGRWSFDPAYRWYWVPGDTWAPAWVQWRYGDEYVGWAPEAPVATGGYAYGGPARYAPPPPQDSWVFVQPRYLVSPAVRSYAVPRTSISIAFIRSTHVYRPEYRNGRICNYGMPRDRWSRFTRQRIEPRRIYRGHSRARPHHWNGRGPRDLYVYAPGVKKGAGPRRPPTKVSHKPSKAKANAAQKKSARNKPPQTKVPHQRAMGLAPPNVLGRPAVAPPQFRGHGLRPPDPRTTLGVQGGAQHPRMKGASVNPKPANSTAAKSKSDIAKSNAAKAQGARVRAAKAKAANTNAKSAAGRTKAKPKTANAKSGPGPGAHGGRGSGNGKHAGGNGGDGKQGGGNRAAACKANPNLPSCGRRG